MCGRRGDDHLAGRSASGRLPTAGSGCIERDSDPLCAGPTDDANPAPLTQHRYLSPQRPPVLPSTVRTIRSSMTAAQRHIRIRALAGSLTVPQLPRVSVSPPIALRPLPMPDSVATDPARVSTFPHQRRRGAPQQWQAAVTRSASTPTADILLKNRRSIWI